jgi:hypothetical protein
VHQTRIAILGQCHTTGHAGMPPDATFPEVVRRTIEKARPDVSVRVVIEPFNHPADLPAAARRALRHRPNVVIVEVIGWVAVSGRQAVDLTRLPRGVRSTYDRLRHFRRAVTRLRKRWPLSADVIAGVEINLQSLASGPLRFLFPRLPRPTLDAYESALEEAARILAAEEGVEAVFQGPGVFNDAIPAAGLASNAHEIYRGVNDMGRRIAERHGALFVDRLVGAPLPQGSFYLPGSIRPSRVGHEALGHLLAEQLQGASLV